MRRLDALHQSLVVARLEFAVDQGSQEFQVRLLAANRLGVLRLEGLRHPGQAQATQFGVHRVAHDAALPAHKSASYSPFSSRNKMSGATSFEPKKPSAAFSVWQPLQLRTKSESTGPL